MLAPWDHWPSRWEVALEACRRLGGDARELVVSAPATEDEVQAVESELGLRIPGSFRKVLLLFSARVEVTWFLPSDVRPPEPLHGIFSGDCGWNLSELPQIEESRRSWVKAVFSNPDDPYDKVWHDKLAFLEVGNGDQLALELSSAEESPVVYLSHEGDVSNGYHFGRNFIDFIDSWSLVGCVGAEDWQMENFIHSPTSGIVPDAENARTWRRWFGLEF